MRNEESEVRLMKKWMSILLAACLLLALCACGAQESAPAPVGDAPDTGAPAEQGSDTHRIALVNASVNGEDHMELSEEGHFLARAVLPDRASSVDYWTIDGKTADAGGRRYSLEFDSAGAGVVSAVLRERLNVCCDGCYLQFLDDDGGYGGPMYQKVYFEDKYIVPTTDAEHAGGSISCHIAAKVPKGMKVDYWVVNGAVLRFGENVLGFTLIGLTKSLDIQVVFTGGEGTSGADLIMKFDQVTETPPSFPDDDPIFTDNGGDEDPTGWILYTDAAPEEEPDETEGETETSGEHEHDWVYDAEHSLPAGCPGGAGAAAGGSGDGRNAFKCSICGATYYQTIPASHQYSWVADGWSGHYQLCSRCGAIGERGSHTYAYIQNDQYPYGFTYCTVCGYGQEGH